MTKMETVRMIATVAAACGFCLIGMIAAINSERVFGFLERVLAALCGWMLFGLLWLIWSAK